MLCGVPQGSVLGPLLFLVYINDMVHCIDLNSILFADDAVLSHGDTSAPPLHQLCVLPNEGTSSTSFPKFLWAHHLAKHYNNFHSPIIAKNASKEGHPGSSEAGEWPASDSTAAPGLSGL